MLVHCPKCNFSQPKDTYCAKCGIEMDRYRPEKKPILKTLLKNPLTHIVMFGLFIFFGYTTYMNHNTINLKSNNIGQNLNSIQNKKSGHQQIQNSENTNSHSDQNSNFTNQDQNKIENLAVNQQNNLNQQNIKLANNTRKPSSNNSEGSEQQILTSGPWTLQLRFIELPNSTYQNWVSEAQSPEGAYAEMGEFVMGKLSKSQKKFGKNLDNSTKTFSDLKTSKVFNGSLNIEALSEFINFSFNLNQDSTGSFVGEFDITSDDSTGNNKKQFSSSFEMKATELLFIKTATPHNPGKSETSDSEFLIIFDFQSSH
jgi:hypothetical protein